MGPSQLAITRYDERLYMKRQNCGRGLKSLKDVYGDTK